MLSLRPSARRPLLLALGPLALLAGCGSSLKLRVLTDPRDAVIEVRAVGWKAANRSTVWAPWEACSRNHPLL